MAIRKIKLIEIQFTSGANYFTLSEIAPVIEGSTITYLNGWGEKRYWGTPHVTATVFVRTNSFVALHMGYSHKHRGGQGYYYYVISDGEISRKNFSQLLAEQQYLVEQNVSSLPSWAKKPFNRVPKRLIEYKDKREKSALRKAKIQKTKEMKNDEIQRRWEKECEGGLDPRFMLLDFDNNLKVKTKKQKESQRFNHLDL